MRFAICVGTCSIPGGLIEQFFGTLYPLENFEVLPYRQQEPVLQAHARDAHARALWHAEQARKRGVAPVCIGITSVYVDAGAGNGILRDVRVDWAIASAPLRTPFPKPRPLNPAQVARQARNRRIEIAQYDESLRSLHYIISQLVAGNMARNR